QVVFRANAVERHYITGNERLTISLEDGSVVHLNTHSNARVSYDSHVRRIKLSEGEARFHVARDADRPFVVTTDRATVRALGTVFDVYRRADDTKVTVMEGRVEVRSTRDEAAANLTAYASQAGAGEEVAVLATGKLLKVAAPDLSAVSAWTEQRL